MKDEIKWVVAKRFHLERGLHHERFREIFKPSMRNIVAFSIFGFCPNGGLWLDLELELNQLLTIVRVRTQPQRMWF